MSRITVEALPNYQLRVGDKETIEDIRHTKHWCIVFLLTVLAELLIWLYGIWVFQGRQEGVKIDPWEDADYNIYKVTDRFGFLQ